MLINIILLCLSYIIILSYFIYKTRHSYHIYQLEYYRHNRYKLWRKKNRKSVFKIRDLWLLIPALVIIFNVRIGVIINLIISILLWFSRDIYPEKTKLKYTNRIKSSLTISLLVCIALEALACIFINNQIVLVIMNIAVDLLVILSTYAILPVSDFIQIFENHKNKKYYREAEEKLKSMPDLKVIGITGSYGKTSVKNILATILNKKYNTFMTPGNFNTLLGVQRSINNYMKNTDEVFICEMGAKELGRIQRTCELVKPQIGILTAIGPQHLETFGSIENIKKAKMELLNSIPDDGIRIANFESENVRDACKGKNVISYGLDPKFDYYAYDININEDGATFSVHTPNDGDIKDIRTKLIGKLNIINIVGAIAGAKSLEVSNDDIKMAIRFLKPIEHRLEMKKFGDGSIIIDDAYNSNVEGSKNAFETLKLFKGKNRIIVTPGLVDLGDESYKFNKLLGENAAGCADYYILVGDDNTKPIYDGLVSKKVDKDKIYIADNIQNAIKKYNEFDSNGRVVLLENDLPDNYL